MNSRGIFGSTGVFLKIALIIAIRLFKSGNGMYINWSKRPGLSKASSRISGLFVAPTINTFFFTPIPSISVKSWFITRSAASPPLPTPEPREIPIESNSSKKSTHGALWRALSNTSRTFASDSPNHIVSNSGPFTEMKFDEHSVAIAFAIKVFPHPGGP